KVRRMSALAAPPTQGELARRLASGIAELGLDVGKEARAKLLGHLELVEKWNRVHNITAIRDVVQAVSVHLLDSLAIVPHLPGKRMLDAGSGAGFPGIPVALAKPDIHIDLLDSNHKKCAFLRQAIADASLGNARVVCERAESWRPVELHDCIVSRALAELGE